MKNRNLKFMRSETLEEEIYSVINNKGEFLGEVKKVRVGAWSHWCMTWTKDDRFEDGEMIYLSPSCQDEIREFCRNPYKFIANYQPESKQKGAICCHCGSIYLYKDYHNPVHNAHDCCNGEFECGYLQEDGKTFISD